MKKFVFLIISLSLGYALPAQTVTPEKEAELVRSVIQTAYVEGLQNEGDTVKINQGFHPGFELLIPEDNGGLKKYTLAEWKGKIKANLASGKMPRQGDDKISVKFLQVDVTGNAAMAKFEFYVGSKLTFVDYQFLYKYSDGWKIVSKIYYRY